VTQIVKFDVTMDAGIDNYVLNIYARTHRKRANYNMHSQF